MSNKDALEVRVAREESRYQAGVSTCSLVLQAGFFFDGRERNIDTEKESQRLSNVGRLFRAHPERKMAEDNSSYVYSAVYIPGLGTPLNDSATENLHSIMDARQKALPEDIVSGWTDQGKEAVVDTVKGVFKGDWSKVLSNKIEDLVTIKGSYKAAASAATNAVKRATVEALRPIRDNPLVFDVLVTGVDARVDYAKNKFKQTITDIKEANQLPIKLVQVSVFGADTGGALARRFIDELLESVCKKDGYKYYYEDSQVEVNFAGLFDCSRRSMLDQGDTMATGAEWLGMFVPNKLASGTISILAGKKVIEFDKPLHRAVKSALHLVAAHERREYRPLLPLGPLRTFWKERLCPGISEDVTGGLLPNEQRPSAELCRVPLREMYEQARRSQVPFPDFKTLNENDPDIASYFVMLDDVGGHSVKDYYQAYNHYVNCTDVTAEGLERHMLAYLGWLSVKLSDFKEMREKVAGWTNRTELNELNEKWLWLREIERDADKLLHYGGTPRSVKRFANRIFEANLSQKAPFFVDTFFNYFMHDFTSKDRAFSVLDAQGNTLLKSTTFFTPRGIEELADEEKAAA